MRENGTVAENGTEHSSTEHRVGRYGGFVVDGDETLVYDRENPEAWVQSDLAVTLAEVQ